MHRIAQDDKTDLKDHLFPPEANIGSNSHGAESALAKRAAVFPLIFPRGMAYRDIQPAKQADYPLIKYWDEGSFREWFEVNGKSTGQKSRDQLGKKLYFLEDEEGQLLSKTRISNLREFTKGIFIKLRDNIPSALVKSWSHADFEYQQIFYAELRHYFPELGYCTSNWKARQFTSIFYSDWKRERPAKGKKKVESDDETSKSPSNSAPSSSVTNSEERETMKAVPSKRPAEDQPGPSKKPRGLFKIADPLYCAL
jgi:hypothetical protein